MRMSPEDRLREALRARVDTVEVSPDALPRIRARVATPPRRGWSVLAAAAAVAAVIAAAVVVFTPDRVPPPVGLPPASPQSTAAPEPGLPTAAPSAIGTSVSLNLPVYYARNDRLVREFHQLTLTGDGDGPRVAAAVGESLRRDSALDPDYVTLWPDSVSVRGVSFDGHVVLVDLSDVGTGPRGGAANLAVQQLVSTVTAATTYTSIKNADGVRVLVDGKPVAKLWNAVDTSRPVRQAPRADIYAPVWVIDPQQGEKVGHTFTVHLSGTVWEGTVNLRVRGAGGVVVIDQVVQLSAGAPAVGEARVQLTLPSGRYTVESFFVSAKDGTVQGVDDHEFDVG